MGNDMNFDGFSSCDLYESKVAETDLFVALGENVVSFGFGDLSTEEKRSAGEAWWQFNADDIKKTVCKNAADSSRAQGAEYP
jgi:hypothetical protein